MAAQPSVRSSSARLLMTRLRTLSTEPAWQKAVDAYVRLVPTREVVGIDREE